MPRPPVDPRIVSLMSLITYKDWGYALRRDDRGTHFIRFGPGRIGPGDTTRLVSPELAVAPDWTPTDLVAAVRGIILGTDPRPAPEAFTFVGRSAKPSLGGEKPR